MNGSDYPLLSIKVTTNTTILQLAGYITKRERDLLNEIWSMNPLLYDYTLKRVLTSPTGNKFNPSIFVKNPSIF